MLSSNSHVTDLLKGQWDARKLNTVEGDCRKTGNVKILAKCLQGTNYNKVMVFIICSNTYIVHH